MLQLEKGRGQLKKKNTRKPRTRGRGESPGQVCAALTCGRSSVSPQGPAAPGRAGAALAQRGAGGQRRRALPAARVPPPRRRGPAAPRSPQKRALASAQLLLPDLESWELFALRILKGQSASSGFCIRTEGNNPTVPPPPEPGFQEQILGRDAAALVDCVLSLSTGVSQLGIL